MKEKEFVLYMYFKSAFFLHSFVARKIKQIASNVNARILTRDYLVPFFSNNIIAIKINKNSLTHQILIYLSWYLIIFVGKSSVGLIIRHSLHRKKEKK